MEKFRLLPFVLSVFLPFAASAQMVFEHKPEANYSFAVFGTAAYSITDTPYRYSRTDNKGTLSQLSRLGAQFDMQFTPQWSATIQGELAPATYKDDHYHPRLSWAFLTYRPNDNWMFRVGKLRIPLMMHAENMPVGVSYVQSQLPLEIYAISPVYDLTGAILSYTWNLKNNQVFTWEGYAGMTRSHFRIFYRGGFPDDSFPENTAYFLPFQASIFGTSVLWQDFERERRFRAKIFYAPVKKRGSGSRNVWAKEPARFEYAPGRYSYMPVPGLDGGTVYDRLKLLFMSLSLDWNLGYDFHFVGEAVHSISLNTDMGLDSSALYLLFYKRFGKWTPYVSLGGIHPSSKVRNYLREMGQPTGSTFLDKMNMSTADNLVAMHQWSFALGTSYDITPRQRIKLAWMHSQVANASTVVSARSDQNFKHKNINMFSISYSFLFDF